jgi:hypothetical protein
MNGIGRRFLIMLGIQSGLVSAFLVGGLLVRWLIPGAFGSLPGWLPEDTLIGMGFQFLSDLMDWLPSLTFSSLLLVISFQLRPEDLPSGKSQALVRMSLLAVLVTVAFAALELLAQPWVSARLDDLEFRNTQTRQLEDAYLKIKAQGSDKQSASDLETRLALLKRLGLLRPLQGQRGGNERFDYDFELQILKAHFELDEFFKLRALPGVVEAVDGSQATVEELLSHAEQALADVSSEKEYQANLWGYQAYRRLINLSDQGRIIDFGTVQRAKAVVDQSWARIYQKTLDTDERRKASYFFRKGKSLGDFQFQNYLEAYYGFQELHKENPRDQEVARFWDLSRQKTDSRVLFAQEMNVLFQVPGSENLVFLNRDSPLEVVRIGRLLNTSQGVFLKDFEFLRIDAKGQVLLHWTAPFGRWTDEGIDFRVWDKDTPMPRFPVVLLETPGNEYNPQASVDPPKFVPRVTVRDLEVVSAHNPRPQTLGTWDLLIHGQAIEALGYNSRLFQTEFVVRLVAPFGFFIAFLFLFALAWGQRAHDPSRTWRLLILILPLLAEFLVQLASWASRLAVGGLLQELGLAASVEFLAAVVLAGSVAGVSLVHHSLQKSLS